MCLNWLQNEYDYQTVENQINKHLASEVWFNSWKEKTKCTSHVVWTHCKKGVDRLLIRLSFSCLFWKQFGHIFNQHQPTFVTKSNKHLIQLSDWVGNHNQCYNSFVFGFFSFFCVLLDIVYVFIAVNFCAINCN